jgi:hypothetical protein
VFVNQFTHAFRVKRKMTQAKVFVTVFSVISLLAIVQAIASAEWATDFYLGLAMTQDADRDVETSSSVILLDKRFTNV